MAIDLLAAIWRRPIHACPGGFLPCRIVAGGPGDLNVDASVQNGHLLNHFTGAKYQWCFLRCDSPSSAEAEEHGACRRGWGTARD